MNVYLIHFDQPFAHARHYIGWTDDLDARMERHKAGHGSRLMEVVTTAGITWRISRIWDGGKNLERRLKRQKHSSRLCPACSGQIAYKRGIFRKEGHR